MKKGIFSGENDSFLPKHMGEQVINKIKEVASTSHQLPYGKIIENLIKMEAPGWPKRTIADGMGRTTVFTLANNLRYLTDFNAARITDLLYPDYSFGLTKEEVDTLVRTAVTRPQSLMPKRLQEIVRYWEGKTKESEADVLQECANTNIPTSLASCYPSMDDTIQDELSMPHLPAHLERALRVAPLGYKLLGLLALEPALATLLTDIRCKYGTKNMTRLNCWTHVDGLPTSNKRPLMMPVWEYLAEITRQDNFNLERTNKALKLREAETNPKKKKEIQIPELPIRILPPGTTRKQHIRMMAFAKEKHTFTHAEELDSLGMRQGGYYDRRDFMRLLFDNGETGCQASTDANYNVKVAWNLTTTSTRDQTLRFWRSPSNGETTRVLFGLSPYSLLDDMPDYEQYDEVDKKVIARASNLMMKMQGLVLTPKLDKAMLAWNNVILQECRKTNDEIRAMFKNRIGDIAHRFGVVMQLCWVAQAIMNKEDHFEAKKEKLVQKLEEAKTQTPILNEEVEQLEEQLRQLEADKARFDMEKMDLSKYRERKEAIDMAVFVANYALKMQELLWKKRMKEQTERSVRDTIVTKRSTSTLEQLPDVFTFEDMQVLWPEAKEVTLRKMVSRWITSGKVTHTKTENRLATYQKVKAQL